VGVAHDDGVAGADKAFFGKQGVTDAVCADVEEILDAVAPGPVAENLGLGCGLGVLAGGNVVDDRLDFGGVSSTRWASNILSAMVFAIMVPFSLR